MGETCTEIAWAQPALGASAEVLTQVYEDHINLAVWQRTLNPNLDTYAQEWCQKHEAWAIKQIVPTEDVEALLSQELPELKHKDEFIADLELLIDMFSCLFEVKEVGLRLTPLRKAMCPKFHVDNIPCRMVSTYGGPGSQWLQETDVNRSLLGRGSKGLSDEESGLYPTSDAIQQLGSQEVALLKGSGWEGNEQSGIVHRSPALHSGQCRLLLTLDFY
ncbi:DUF1826 domain-containing protein [Marinibactrum halimedae]|uniref:DUF1826 domain-containing protein n=1 Tax=Marinibactrum halimedae TaxID=1444977 RepID=A0AA37T604_9GAMM|nr:DUF1826 domain-containing protein [Marinibactrum halimedae]MCD9460077.1 DUF1826 domain-containing protein [Marinibactrum halimedae]GLS26476.1 hypothetical protein GCM10007877_21920 [Marinibactrum halimedae]